MQNSFIIASYATENTPYEDILNKYFLNSISKLDKKPPYAIKIIKNLGGWHLNTAYKPKYILELMKTYESMYDSILLVDADATIESYPQLFHDIPKEYDIAAHILDQDKWYRNGSHINELLSGTLWIRINEKTKKMVWEWEEEIKKSNELEQVVLAKTLVNYHNIKLYELPLSYCYISSLPGGLSPYIKLDKPVIVHHQCSRQTKKWFKYQKYNINPETIK